MEDEFTTLKKVNGPPVHAVVTSSKDYAILVDTESSDPELVATATGETYQEAKEKANERMKELQS